jgi:DNA-binding response OmpR family regulator
MTAAQRPDAKALLAHARHELRTPVNAILGYSEMLLEDAGDPEAAELGAGLREIQALGKALQEGINQVLDAGRAEEGPALDTQALTMQVRQRLRPACSQVVSRCAGLLELARSPALQPFRADLQRIGTASAQLLALIDDPLGQPGPAVLAAPAMRQPAPVAEGGEAGHLLEEGGPPSPAERGHVLVVDDNTLNRDMLGRALHRQQHYFALARDGNQALEMLRSGAFDVVLLDVMMPGMDGFEVLARLKADPALRHLPVIMISALDDLAAVVRCIEMGAEDYLPKPFDPVLLRARVGACLEKKRRRDQELDYLRNVAVVTEAAGAVEAGTFDPEALEGVARRGDALGQLARVFQRMAREVRAREERLRREVQELRVEIDQQRKARQVAEITETAYFQELQQKAQALRNRSPRRQG